MPQRILSDTILGSKKLARLTAEAEVMFYRLLVVVDNMGRADADPMLLRSACFPLRTHEIEVRNVEEWLSSLEAHGLIVRYANGPDTCLQIVKWGDYQRLRFKVSKFPAPPDDLLQSAASRRELQQVAAIRRDLQQSAVDVDVDVDRTTNVRSADAVTHAPVRLKRVRDEYDPAFEPWWNAYPAGRRLRKKAAYRLWRHWLDSGVPPDDLLRAATNYAADVRAKATEDRFVLHPTTFLSKQQEPWRDYLGSATPGAVDRCQYKSSGVQCEAQQVGRVRTHYGEVKQVCSRHVSALLEMGGVRLEAS